MARTELHEAALKGDAARAGELIEAGLDVNAADGKGLTPLHFAAQSGSGPTVRLLLEHGANPNQRDWNGIAPLWSAISNWTGSDEIIGLLSTATAIQLQKAAPAPQEAPATPTPKPFGPGARVSHPQFGEGTLLAIRQGKFEVEFDTAGRKILLERFVTPAKS